MECGMKMSKNAIHSVREMCNRNSGSGSERKRIPRNSVSYSHDTSSLSDSKEVWDRRFTKSPIE
jgi:hypothetical protein